MIAMGVASPSAHGHEITRTATMAIRPSWNTAQSLCTPAAIDQPARVHRAMPSTMGTKTALTRSASRWISVLDAMALVTSSAIRDTVVFRPSTLASIRRRPVVFMLPAITSSPVVRAMGIDSPVTTDSSRSDSPSRTMPSIGTREPGRITSRSPGSTSALGMRSVDPSAVSRSAVSGCSSRRSRTAEPAWAEDRASSQCPRLMTPKRAAASVKYIIWSLWTPVSIRIISTSE